MTRSGPVRAAVLGSPVAHSLSPALHRAAYAHLGLTEWSYDAIEVDRSGLAGFLAGLDDSWRGLSLTMPLKESVIDLLDDVSPTAQSVRAVNTVVIGPDRRFGLNTDVSGMVAVLREVLRDVPRLGGTRPDLEVVVLGGGATARSCLAALSDVGFESATAYVRRVEGSAEMSATAERVALSLTVRPWPELALDPAARLIISTAPAHATDELTGLVPPRTKGTLVDVVYSPWPTALAAAWQTAGGAAVGGLELLVHQAVGQVRAFTGREVPVDVLRAAAHSSVPRDPPKG
jgi:shikimate dehydrogenase